MRYFVLLLALSLPNAAPAQSPSPEAPSVYAAGARADRIVLTPGDDPARSMSVAFRTGEGQTTAQAEISVALDGPGLERTARLVQGASTPIETQNGGALYHQVRFTDLEPTTTYAYRVRGEAGWSEWLQFRTAADDDRPFQFIYLGDTQNDILANGARTIRQAQRAAPDAALMIHAGDLVAQGRTGNHDDEWGQWTRAGGHGFAMTPQLPVAGNHEYVAKVDADGGQLDILGPHWPLQFALPGGGAPGLEATTYVLDHQGVRFIALDGTAALADSDLLDRQTVWLEHALTDTAARWKIVMVHQPLFTCARPQNTPRLEAAWRPVLEAGGADLVLQGHDHCYSRISSPDRLRNDAATPDADVGPVYVVSVAGPKMYQLNDRAAAQSDRVAEDTQLYQVVTASPERLAYRAYTVAGRLYDAFDIEVDGGAKRIVPVRLDRAEERVCVGDLGPDGLPCSGRDLSRLLE